MSPEIVRGEGYSFGCLPSDAMSQQYMWGLRLRPVCCESSWFIIKALIYGALGAPFTSWQLGCHPSIGRTWTS